MRHLCYVSNRGASISSNLIQRWQQWHIHFASHHYNDVIMGAIASEISSLTIVYSTVYSDADQRKHQSSASLIFVRGIHRGPVNSPHKWPVTRKMFPFDDVIMLSSGQDSHFSDAILVTSHYLNQYWLRCMKLYNVSWLQWDTLIEFNNGKQSNWRQKKNIYGHLSDIILSYLLKLLAQLEIIH